ncbi:tripartite tricarboxylate transporter substrate-binding protein, partial [Enterovirga sp.]|uniref:Bug family tripartite tricarboxylate transporter substrate binding protein n=1 Tax=Enterovirga sp. TaxID=2026350 RepID=UPI0026046B76
LPTALPQIEAKAVRALAVTTAQRVGQLAEVPTMQEAGVPDYEIIGWLAAFSRAGTPPDLVARLNAGILKAINAPDAESFFRSIGGEPFGSTPAELGAFVQSETAKWATYVAVSGIEKQ